MVPVLRDADQLSFAEIEKGIAALAVKARDGKITVTDLQGGTFTITNGGVFGSLLSTPILNPPQSAILGMHTIQKRPVAVDDQVVIRPMMYLALSYDHRLIDGREAVSFLVRVKECIENPRTAAAGSVRVRFSTDVTDEHRKDQGRGEYVSRQTTANPIVLSNFASLCSL